MKFKHSPQFEVFFSPALLLLFSAYGYADIAPVPGPPYRIPDQYVSTSFGDTPSAAAEVWWEKYKVYWGVVPHGTLECSYYITGETGGVLGRIGRVRLSGKCRGSDPIESTLGCPDGYQLAGDICTEIENAVIEEKNTPNPCHSTSQPVNFTTGNKFIEEIDYVVQNNQHMQFHRIWNSYNKKWLFSYRQYLTDISTSIHTVSLYRDDGRVVRFNDVQGNWMPDANVRDRLIKEGEDWLYIMSTGDKEWFDSAGKLLRIQAVDGSLLTVSYPDSTSIKVANEYGSFIELTLDAVGQVVSMADPDGKIYRYAYDSNHNLEYVSYPDASPGVSGSNPFAEDNPTRRYHYEDVNNMNLVTGITDENGDRSKTIVYDAQGRAIASGLSDGSIGESGLDYTAMEDAVDPLVTVTNALGKDTVYHLETYFGVKVVTEVEGIASAHCLADVQRSTYYADTGWLTRSYNTVGVATYYEYHTDPGRYGLLKKRVEAEGTREQRTFIFDWDSATALMTREELEGQRRTDLAYHPNGRIHTRTETDLTNGNVRVWTTSYTYYESGADTRIETMIVDGPLDGADVEVYEYSSQGFLTRMTNAAGHLTQYKNHNGRGQPRRIIDPNGIAMALTYTARGWLASIRQDVDGIDALTQVEYDNIGQIVRIVLADDSSVDFEYDSAHRLTDITNGRGERIQFALDAAGNPDSISFKNAEGTEARNVDYQFDELSRLFSVYGADGQEMHYEYGSEDQLRAIADGVNPPIVQDYDALNRLSVLTDPASNILSIAYDSAGRLETVVDQRGLSTDYAFDGFGNLRQVTSPDTGVTGYTYDKAGNRLSKIDARNVITNYTYDSLSRLKTISYPGESAKNVTYTYDNWAYCSTCNGRLALISDSSGQTAYFYDTLGRMDYRINNVLVPRGEILPLSTSFSYNAASRLTALQYPNGQVVNFAYDETGQVRQVTRQTSVATMPVSVADAISYEPYGPVRDITYGNLLQMHRDYDLDGRLTRQTIGGLEDREYDYDLLNNISEIINRIDPTRNEAYTYDPLNRIESAVGRYGAIDYEYDAVGNRRKRTIERDDQLVTETYIYPLSNNRLQRIDRKIGDKHIGERLFLYDATGNLIDDLRADGSHFRPHYDNANRMEFVTP